MRLYLARTLTAALSEDVSWTSVTTIALLVLLSVAWALAPQEPAASAVEASPPPASNAPDAVELPDVDHPGGFNTIVPEPIALAFLAGGGVVILARRRIRRKATAAKA